jgi:L-asparaginase
MKRKVLLIYTGGTIGMEKDYESGSLRAFDFGNIFEKMPEMKLMECEVLFILLKTAGFFGYGT